MMLIEVSKELAKPLARHVKPTPPIDSKNHPDLFWRAELVQIGVDTCVVAQEQFTQYILVLCGLDRESFERFPQFIGERIWREATAICKQAELYDTPTLSKHLKTVIDEQQYRMNPEPLEEGKLLSVIEKLERRFVHDRKPLPVDGKSAFEFGFAINSRRPKVEQLDDKPTAAEAFGNLCLNLVENLMRGELDQIEACMPAADNIVRIDFSQRNAKS